MISDLNGGRRLTACVAASFFLHLPLFWPWAIEHSHAEAPETIEMDLVSSPAKAGKGPGPKNSGAPAEAPAPPPKEWTLPTDAIAKAPVPSAEIPEAHAPESHEAGISEPGKGSSSGGTGDASGSGGAPGSGSGAGSSSVLIPPVLLNHGELHRLLRKLYPDNERSLGREGLVVLSLSIGEDGRVSSVEVDRSGGRSFDEAAKTIAPRLRYSPALRDGRPMAVRLRQSVIFKLEQ